jgi:hypothetical protein
MYAATDSGSSGILDIAATERRVQRRDLVLGPTDTANRASRGTVTGVVMDSGGRPISDARVIVDGAPELRSGSDGQFVVRGVPTGTRQLEVLSLGMAPVVTTVDVMPNDTTAMLPTMKTLTTLDVVRVTASPVVRRLLRELDERRKTGFGSLRDSIEIGNRGTLSAVFSEFAGTRVESRGGSTPFLVTLPSARGGRCAANVVIDGSPADFDQLQFYRPGDLAAIEVYPHRFSVPSRFLRGNSECGAIIVWTKWMLR